MNRILEETPLEVGHDARVVGLKIVDDRLLVSAAVDGSLVINCLNGEEPAKRVQTSSQLTCMEVGATLSMNKHSVFLGMESGKVIQYQKNWVGEKLLTVFVKREEPPIRSIL